MEGMRQIEGEGFVLAGGRSLRMGARKALLPYGNATLLDRSICLLRDLGFSVRLVIAADDEMEDVSVPVVRDRIPGAGPLGAIYTALMETKSSHCFILPCDTPLVGRDLFEVMMDRLEEWDAIVPEDSTGRLHPLSAYYSTSCLEAAGDLLQNDQRRVRTLLESSQLRVLRLSVGELGIPDYYFSNVNTPEEYRQLLENFQ